MDPTQRFADLVARANVPLDEAAFVVAAHAWPKIDIVAELGRLDDLASRVEDPSRDRLRRVLFGEVGLRGNAENYYDPDNSFLNRVLDTGLGIPISLAVAMIEVGRRAGVTLQGISAPAHFLVLDLADGAFLDPFHAGAEIAGEGPPATTIDILARMLANLRSIYTAAGDIANLIWVLRLRTLLPGAGPEADHELTRVRARLN